MLNKSVYTLLILLATCLFWACSEKKKPNLKLLSSEFLLLKKVPLTFSIKGDLLIHQKTFGNVAYFIDDGDFTLYTLHLTKCKFTRVTQLPISSIEGYTITNHGKSIITFSKDSIFELSSSGKLIRSKAIGKTHNGYLTVVNGSGYSIGSEGSKAYFHFFPDISETYQSPDFFKEPIQAEYDLKTDKISLMNHYYPKEYLTKCFGYQFAPNRIFISGNKHVFTFPYNDSIYLYTKDHLSEVNYFGSLRKHHFEHIQYAEISRLNKSVFDDFFNTQSSYPFANYFAHSKIYSRVYWKKNANSNQFSFVLYDNRFNYLGETKFRNNLGYFFDSQKFGPLNILFKGKYIEIYQTKWNKLN